MRRWCRTSRRRQSPAVDSATVAVPAAADGATEMALVANVSAARDGPATAVVSALALRGQAGGVRGGGRRGRLVWGADPRDPQLRHRHTLGPLYPYPSRPVLFPPGVAAIAKGPILGDSTPFPPAPTQHPTPVCRRFPPGAPHHPKMPRGGRRRRGGGTAPMGHCGTAPAVSTIATVPEQSRWSRRACLPHAVQHVRRGRCGGEEAAHLTTHTAGQARRAGAATAGTGETSQVRGPAHHDSAARSSSMCPAGTVHTLGYHGGVQPRGVGGGGGAGERGTPPTRGTCHPIHVVP